MSIKYSQNMYSIILSPIAPFDPSDSKTYYWGVGFPATIYDVGSTYLPKDGVIKTAAIYQQCITAPSSQSWSFYIGVDKNYTLLKTFNGTTGFQYFIKTLNLVVAMGQGILIKEVCPAWSTNPTGVYTNIVLYITTS